MQFRPTAPCADTPPQPVARRGRRGAAALATTIGAAALVGTTFAPPADAAVRYRVWNRVANCESSQRWHINSGNGYYGGLQFSAGTWAAYHGHRYAAQANRATRAEQIEVARRVLAAQGPGAWPVCGPRAGLTRVSGRATRAALPRTADTGRRGHPKARPLARHDAAHHGHHKAAHQRHHKSRRHHHATYKVRSGDTLSAITRRLHVRGGWHALYRANRSHLANPNVLHIGQLLRVP